MTDRFIVNPNDLQVTYDPPEPETEPPPPPPTKREDDDAAGS